MNSSHLQVKQACQVGKQSFRQKCNSVRRKISVEKKIYIKNQPILYDTPCPLMEKNLCNDPVTYC